MKRIILFIFSVIVVSLQAQSTREVTNVTERSYYKVEEIINNPQTITDNKVWHFDTGYPCIEADESDNAECFCYMGLRTFRTGNHKMFNGKEYTELLSNSVNNPNEWTTETYLREANKQVFFFSEKCGKEFLMYDFNLKLNDKIVLVDYLLTECELNEQGEAGQGESFLYTVALTDSVIYNQIKYKRIELRGNMHLYWIEGLGDISGILYHSAGWGGALLQLRDSYISENQVFF
ncbi:MAG: hypothetical protein LBB85_12295, partial [Dysgonamonadaceae bacterium]|nr:hypothetical protein [Dysgonamonadaceae bacterium]